MKIKNKINENQVILNIDFNIRQTIKVWEITPINIKIGGLYIHKIIALKRIMKENKKVRLKLS